MIESLNHRAWRSCRIDVSLTGSFKNPKTAARLPRWPAYVASSSYRFDLFRITWRAACAQRYVAINVAVWALLLCHSVNKLCRISSYIILARVANKTPLNSSFYGTLLRRWRCHLMNQPKKVRMLPRTCACHALASYGQAANMHRANMHAKIDLPR